jgi:hypothetical protein
MIGRIRAAPAGASPPKSEVRNKFNAPKAEKTKTTPPGEVLSFEPLGV